MDRERLDKWCEWGIFGLVLSILTFAPLAMGAEAAVPFLVLQGLACGVLLIWGLRVWVAPSCRFLWPPICWPVLGFIGYAIVRYHYADIEYLARLELIKVIIYAVVFFAILNYVNRQELSLALCLGLIFVASADSLYAIFQYATHSNRVLGSFRPINSYGSRVGGTFINPNHLAGFLEMIVPAALSLVVAGRLGHALKVVLAYLAGLMLIAVALTFSRGGFVAVAISLLTLLLLLVSRRNYRLPAILLLVVLGCGACYFGTHSRDLDHRIKQALGNSGSQDARIYIWQGARRMWLDHPWFGVGPGHFDDRFRQYRPEWVQRRPQYAHNDYLNTLAEWGTIGALPILAVFALYYWGVAKTWPFVHRAGNALLAKKSNRPAIVLGGATAIFAMLIHAVTEFNMQIPANALLAVAWLALVSSYLRFATEGYWVTLRPLGRSIATLVILPTLAFLAWQGVRRGEVNYWLDRADREVSATGHVPFLKQALTAEPMDSEISYTLAETLRKIGSEAQPWDEKTIREAMIYFTHGMDVNPWDPYNYIWYGWCLDWIGQNHRATPFFDHAVALDPNNAFINYRRGRHAMSIEDYRQARRWLNRSLLLDPWYIPEARGMTNIVAHRIAEAETSINSPLPPLK